MQLQELRLSNFRMFSSFHLELDPRVTVLIGQNATGKSTILDAIAMALSDWTSGFLPEEYLAPQPNDVRFIAVDRAGVATTEQQFPLRIELTGSVFKETRFRCRRLITGQPGLHPQPHDLPIHLIRLSSGTPLPWPLVAYYRTSRLWNSDVPPVPNISNSSEDGLQNRAWGYHHALTAGFDHKGFEAWMAWREADRVQRLARAFEEGTDPREVKSPQLEGVAAAAMACLEGAKRFYYSANHRELRVDFEGGPSIPFRALSDGQRNVIAVAADIAWRAAQLNPDLGANAPLETPGVVLIDELDLHLHPKWQLRVLDDLLRAFPKIQFIVTTHSPQIMSAAPPNGVRLLDGSNTAHKVDRLRGRDTNSILEDVLGVPSRPPQWKRDLDELSRLIEDGHLDQARALIAKLEQEKFYSDDAALVAARWELAMAGDEDAKD